MIAERIGVTKRIASGRIVQIRIGDYRTSRIVSVVAL